MKSPVPRHEPLWLTEEDVGSCIDLNNAISALEEGLALEASGDAANIIKALATWDPGSATHSLGSLMPGRGYAGFKTWAITPKGGSAVFALFDAKEGRQLALMEAGLLGLLRTAGISGLATRALADPDADEMAVIGTGRQAMMQVASVAVTRPIRRLKVWSRTPANRDAFIAKIKERFPFVIEGANTVEEALSDMPIVTLITRAQDPFVDAQMIAKGAHVNAAGAILPKNAEFLPNLFDRSDMVVVDNLDNARKASREFRDHYGENDEAWRSVMVLGDVLAKKTSRPANCDVTLFKPMGMGLSDLSVAIAVYNEAVAKNIGIRLPAKHVPAARWTLAQPGSV
jgi:ornithine cyclodeaminase